MQYLLFFVSINIRHSNALTFKKKYQAVLAQGACVSISPEVGVHSSKSEVSDHLGLRLLYANMLFDLLIIWGSTPDGEWQIYIFVGYLIIEELDFRCAKRLIYDPHWIYGCLFGFPFRIFICTTVFCVVSLKDVL